MSSEFLEAFIEEAKLCLGEIRSGLVSYKQEAELAYLSHALQYSEKLRSAVPLEGFGSLIDWISYIHENLEKLVSGASTSEVNQLLERIDSFEKELNNFLAASQDFGLQKSNLSDSEIDNEMLEVFASEAEEHFLNIARNLKALEENSSKKEALWEIRRSFHTLKGSAGIVGLEQLSKLAHKAEDLLDYLAQKPESLNSQVFQVLYSVLECMEFLSLNEEASAQTERKIDELEKQISAVKVENTELLRINSLPSNKVSLPASEPAKAVIRVSLERLNDLASLVQELMTVSSFFEDQFSKLKQQVEELKNISKRFSMLSSKIETDFSSLNKSESNRDSKQDFDVLELDRYTEFHQTSLELTETASDTSTITDELMQILNEISYIFTAYQRLIREARDRILRLRMIPFSTLSQRLRRAVQMVADEEGKKVDFLIEDSGIEIESEILHLVVEPLLHLLRNAVSHGIESPEIRKSLGKLEFGKVVLSVSKDETHISFLVKDDGKGVSVDELKKRAIEMNLFPEEQIRKMSSKEALNLMFVSGLSTVSEVSEISGRGIGMEVVKACVERFKGKIEVRSELGKGTEFVIYLPLSLSVAKVIPVRVGGEIYAFPIKMLHQVTELTKEEFELARNSGRLVIGNEFYRPLYLGEVLGTEVEEIREKSIFVLLVKGRKGAFALAAEKLLKPEEVVINPPKGLLSKVNHLLGASILSNGRVMPVLDLIGMVELIEDTVLVRETSVNQTKKQIMIMIIDDSPSVRKVNEKIITNVGWKVLTARDGLEALEILGKSDEIPNVILTDIEMPRMDGYELLKTLKKNSRYKNIPVLIITSRTSEKHRQKALQLGASSYITKPFDQRTLIEKIRSLVQ